MTGPAVGRFAIQRHTGHGPEHWDLMIEDGEVLAAWHLERPPTPHDQAPIPAERIPDHRKHYLTYEGPVGGGRGDVALHDSGTATTLDRTPDKWRFRLEGRHVNGTYVLERSPGGPARPSRWTLRREPAE